MRITLNGEAKHIEVDSEKSSLWILRADLGLVGTKYGCGQALCGACTIHIDGQPARTRHAGRNVQSGQVMAAVGLLSNNRKPTDQDIDEAMSGNICRCNTYRRIRAAIHDAAKLLEA